MVKIREDLTGRIFGRLKVIKQVEDYICGNGIHKAQWLCECSCEPGKLCYAQGVQLTKGVKQSCGCLRKKHLDEMHENNCKSNIYDLSGEYGIGWATNTNEEFYFDLDDYELIQNYCWYTHVLKHGHRVLEARNRGNNKPITMHRLLGFKNYDHINRNPLDNRKENLRPATRSENAQNHPVHKNNTSGVIGVDWYKRDSVWRVRICVNKKRIELGKFIDKDDAIRARLQAEQKYFGEFAPQQHLYEQYGITEQND